jgi:CRISPR/Cas system-associated exonuclease Cas4 (RecB family)
MSLIGIINEKIVESNKAERANHKPGKFYPSSVGKCLRAIVYQMLGYEGREPDAKGLSIMDNGTYFHERMESNIRKTDIFVASELPLKNEQLNISGRLDLVIKNFSPHTPDDKIVKLINHKSETVYEGPSNDVMIVELKSINEKGFTYLKGKGEPKEEHVQQIQLYMYMTGIHSGILLYENKNTQEMMDFYVEYNEEVVQEVVIKIMKAKQYKERTIIPPRDYAKSSMQCTYCDFKNVCWAENS